MAEFQAVFWLSIMLESKQINEILLVYMGGGIKREGGVGGSEEMF